jgi:alkaline phosphatase
MSAMPAIRTLLCLLTVGAIGVAPASSQTKNVILFVGDGVGVSSLNAASILGPGEPQGLYLQRMPHLALTDTSTAKEWVTDAAAAATAWATGHKGRNGVISMSAEAVRGVTDGDIYKTVLEEAMERGLATGIISSEGVAGAAVSAFYAHHNDRAKAGEIFQQALHPRFGNGPDVIIGAGRRTITDQTTTLGRDLAADIRARGYAYVHSMPGLNELPAGQDRVIALFDDGEFDFNAAVQQAVARLSKNPKGFVLIAHSDCHTGKARTSLQRLLAMDKAVAGVGEQRKTDTLILFTADHSYDLRIKGETLTETAKAADHTKIVSAVSLEDEHTAEEVPLLGMGPGSERIHGFMTNTDVFEIMMSALRSHPR